MAGDRKGIGGPKTQAGKDVSKMNGLTHGRFLKNFHQIPASKCGTLKICIPCGHEQQGECAAAGTCFKQDELIVRYHKMHTERNPIHVEELTIRQLAMFDFLFDQKLMDTIQNLGEQQEVYTKDGKKMLVPKITNEDYHTLMAMLDKLKKSPADLQLTRATQQEMNLEIAKLLEAKIDPDQAQKFKEQVMNQNVQFEQSQAEAEKLAAEDEMLQNWIKTGSLQKQEKETKKLPPQNPFSKK